MAKRKAAKKTTTGGAQANQNVEPMVLALAEQLGTFLGRVQKKADGWLENEDLRQQVSQIRDRASELLQQVGEAGAAARKSVAAAASKAKAPATPKRRARDGEVASPKRQRREGDKAAAKGRSGGAVDAPGKRHRRPPPQELFDPRLGEPMGKQMGQKSLKRRGRG